MKDEVFNNTSGRVIRIFFAIAGGFALIAAVPLIMLWVLSFRGGVSDDTRQGCYLTVLIILPLMLAMVFSALLTIPAARKANREFDQFRRGDLLVRWEYAPEFWLPYVEAETHRLRKAAKGGFWLIFGPIGVLAIYIGYMVARDSQSKIEVIAIVVALLAGSMSIYIVSAKAVVRFRRNALLNCPRAYIGSTAIYCGGIFNFWGSQLHALQSVRLLPGHDAGHPGLLEFIIGMSTGARRTVTAVNVVSMLAASPAYASSQSARQVIPIPPGEEARAREIAALLGSAQLSARSVAITSVATTSVATGPVAAAPPHISPHVVERPPAPKKAPALSGLHVHDPALLRKKAVHWFVATVILLIGGLALFLVAMPLDSGRPAGTQPSSLTTAIEVAGLFAWMASPATLVLSIVQWFRSRRTSHPHIGFS